MTLLADSRLALVAGAPHRALRYLAPTAFVTDFVAVCLAGAAATFGRDRLEIFDPSIVQVSDTLGLAGPLMMGGWLLMLWLVGGTRATSSVPGTDEYKRVLNASVLAAGLVGVGCLPRQVLALPWLLPPALHHRCPDADRGPVPAPPGAVRRRTPRGPPAARPHSRHALPCGRGGQGAAPRDVAGLPRRRRAASRRPGSRPRPGPASPCSARPTSSYGALRWPTPTSSSSPAARSTRPASYAESPGSSRSATSKSSWRPASPTSPPSGSGSARSAACRSCTSTSRAPCTPRGPASGLRPRRVALAAGALRAAPRRLRASAIKLHDRGPVLFAQARVGRDGSTFRCLKFRSMVVDAEQRLAELHARSRLRGRPVQDGGRPADHPARPLAAPLLDRRAAPAVQRAARRDEPGRPTAAAADRGGALRQATPSAGCGSAPA